MSNVLIHPMVLEMGAIDHVERDTGLTAAVDLNGRLSLERPTTLSHGEFCGAGEHFNPKGVA